MVTDLNIINFSVYDNPQSPVLVVVLQVSFSDDTDPAAVAPKVGLAVCLRRRSHCGKAGRIGSRVLDVGPPDVVAVLFGDGRRTGVEGVEVRQPVSQD